jgi:hypothetical protein
MPCDVAPEVLFTKAPVPTFNTDPKLIDVPELTVTGVLMTTVVGDATLMIEAIAGTPVPNTNCPAASPLVEEKVSVLDAVAVVEVATVVPPIVNAPSEFVVPAPGAALSLRMVETSFAVATLPKFRPPASCRVPPFRTSDPVPKARALLARRMPEFSVVVPV